MQPYTIEEHTELGYLVLYFPSDSSWLGAARIVAEELTMFLNVVENPISLLIDITDSRPTIALSTVDQALRSYSKLSNHKNLKQILLVTDDYFIRQAAQTIRTEFASLHIFRSRQMALNYLAVQPSSGIVV